MFKIFMVIVYHQCIFKGLPVLCKSLSYSWSITEYSDDASFGVDNSNVPQIIKNWRRTENIDVCGPDTDII